MQSCNCAPDGAFVLSEGSRFKPLNPYTATRYFEGNDLNESSRKKLFTLAEEAAGDIYTSALPWHVDLFLSFVADLDYGEAFGLLQHVYEVLERNMPLGIRAAAAIPNIWVAFCNMAADELEFLYEVLNEIDPFVEVNDID